MKNFSDLTAIKTKEQLAVSISLKQHDAEYVFSINDTTISSDNYSGKFDLFDDLSFKCYINKGAVEILSITVNDFEVLPVYQHLANPPTAWITTQWEFVIPAPFYIWKHHTTGQGRIF